VDSCPCTREGFLRERGTSGGSGVHRSGLGLLAIALALSAAPAAAVEPVQLTPGARHSLAAAVELLEDPGGALAVEELVRGPAAAAFRPGMRPLRRSLTPTVYWMRMAVENPAAGDATWQVAYGYPLVSRIDLYELAAGSILRRHGGLAVPLAERTLLHGGPFHAAAVTLSAGERRTLFLRVETRSSLLATPEAWEPAHLARHQWGVTVAFGIGVGVLLILAALRLYGRLVMEMPIGASGAPFILLFAALMATLTGVGPTFLFPSASRWWLSATGVLAAAAVAFGLHFARGFLQLRERDPRLDRLLALFSALSAGASLWSLLERGTGGMAVAAVVAPGLVLTGVVAVRGARRGERAARLFLLATGVLGLAGLAFAAAMLGLAPPDAAAPMALMVGFVVGGTILTVAQADRAILASRHTRLLLEEEVTVRTRDLHSAVEQLRSEAGERRATAAALEVSEALLREAQKLEAVGRLAGGVAHDFNNLLTVITANTGLALSDLPEDGPVRESLLEIRDAARRAGALTRQLLAFGRRQVIAPQPLDLSLHLEGMRSMLGRLLGEEVNLRFELAPGMKKVMVDATQLEQVVMNLVANARDAVPRGGRVVVSTRPAALAEGIAERPAGRYGVLEVADDGSGMTAEIQAQIFEPFFTTRRQGTGLGLATVYGAARQHGGFVEVESAVGKGSTFRVWFPVAEAQEATPELPTPPAAAALPASGTVLLVEDEGGVREVARQSLERAGWKVLAAADGVEALELLDAHGDGLDALVTDVVMPRLNGRELASAVQAKLPGLPVLYVSGYPESVITRNGLLAPGLSLLRKPFEAPDLLAALAAALQAKPGSRGG